MSIPAREIDDIRQKIAGRFGALGDLVWRRNGDVRSHSVGRDFVHVRHQYFAIGAITN